MKFKSRQPTGEIVAVNAPGRDPIVTRILWLKGKEERNRRAYSRYIYIHEHPRNANSDTPPAMAACAWPLAISSGSTTSSGKALAWRSRRIGYRRWDRRSDLCRSGSRRASVSSDSATEKGGCRSSRPFQDNTQTPFQPTPGDGALPNQERRGHRAEPWWARGSSQT